MAKLIVIIDAGHGLNTSGKRTPDGSLREFQFNNPTAQYLGNSLKGYDNVEVHYVHDLTGKRDVPLKERTDKANAIVAKNKGADVIYVSIHANAFGSGWNSANGIETFAYSSRPKGSTDLATRVQSEMIKSTGLRNRGVKFGNFHVLRETKCDAILAECGFMTNQAEAKLLKSDAYRRKIAGAIEKAIVGKYALKKKATPKPAPKASGTMYRVVTGSFGNRANAEQRIKDLKAKGFDSFLLPNGKMYRVVTGSFKDRTNANDRIKALKAKGFDSFLLPYKA